MAFTLAQFRLILAIHEHGSLGRAAPVLRVTQPALSRALGELERQIGVLLFERHPSGLRLTPHGLAVLPYATNVVEEAGRALEEVRVLAGESRQVVRIGSVSSAAAHFLPAVIARLRRSAPSVAIHVTEGVDEILKAGLLAGELDVIIAGELSESEQIMRAIDLKFGDRCTLLVGADHPLRGRLDICAAELIDQTWVTLPTDSMPRKLFEQMLWRQGFAAPKVAVETRSAAIIRELVAHQGFITWAPTPLYVSANPAFFIEALDIPAFEVHRTFSVYRLRGRTQSQAARETLSVVRSFLAEQLSALRTTGLDRPF